MTIQAPAIFPIRHDWATPFKVTREWNTDVQTADDGTEVRTELRTLPHITMQMRGLFLTEMGAGRLLAQWRGATQPLRYYAPLWCDVTEVTADVAAGASFITCDITDRPFFANGGYAMLYRETGPDTATAEVVTINTISGGFSITGATSHAYPAGHGSKVVPCRVMWLAMPVNPTWLSSRIATADLSFVEEVPQAAYALSDAAGTPVPDSITVTLDRRAVSLDSVTKVATARAVVFDADGFPLDASRLNIVWSKIEPGGTSVNVVPAINPEYARCEYVSGSIVASVGVTATLGAISGSASF